jgi:hypothetical protein
LGGSRDAQRVELFIISWPKFTPKNPLNPKRHPIKP